MNKPLFFLLAPPIFPCIQPLDIEYSVWVCVWRGSVTASISIEPYNTFVLSWMCQVAINWPFSWNHSSIVSWIPIYTYTFFNNIAILKLKCYRIRFWPTEIEFESNWIYNIFIRRKRSELARICQHFFYVWLETKVLRKSVRRIMKISNLLPSHVVPRNLIIWLVMFTIQSMYLTPLDYSICCLHSMLECMQ